MRGIYRYPLFLRTIYSYGRLRASDNSNASFLDERHLSKKLSAFNSSLLRCCHFSFVSCFFTVHPSMTTANTCKSCSSTIVPYSVDECVRGIYRYPLFLRTIYSYGRFRASDNSNASFLDERHLSKKLPTFNSSLLRCCHFSFVSCFLLYIIQWRQPIHVKVASRQ
jgi:hypothetical protein